MTRPTARTLLAALLAACAALAAAVPARAAPLTTKKAMWGPIRVGGVSQFPRYRDLGVGIVQVAVLWSDAAPRRPARPEDPADPAYRWPADVSDAVAQARRYGMRVAVSLIGTPAWANGGRPPNWVPDRPADFAAFSAAAARRYPSVRLWMIWGEPTLERNFAPLTPARPGRALTPEQAAAPRRYARLLDAAYLALKAVRRSNLVVGGMTFTAGQITTFQWIQNLRLPGGRRPRLDLYGHNPFSAREPDLRKPLSCCGFVDFSDLDVLVRHLDRHLARSPRQRMPLFLSEWTIPTARGDSEFNFFVRPTTQARWISRALRIARGWNRIYTLGWIHLYDDPPGRGSTGGLLDHRGRRKPGYFAFRSG
jgi:hypothetical protein